jgi:hypothetical protein
VEAYRAAMQTVADYRAHAQECRDIAKTMNGEQHEQMLKMAETWENLAAERERQAHRDRDTPDASS